MSYELFSPRKSGAMTIFVFFRVKIQPKICVRIEAKDTVLAYVMAAWWASGPRTATRAFTLYMISRLQIKRIVFFAL